MLFLQSSVNAQQNNQVNWTGKISLDDILTFMIFFKAFLFIHRLLLMYYLMDHLNNDYED